MGTILKCPNCIPPTIRRRDGGRIVGWMPESIFVGYLKVPRSLGVPRPPKECPECGHALVERLG